MDKDLINLFGFETFFEIEGGGGPEQSWSELAFIGSKSKLSFSRGCQLAIYTRPDPGR